MFNRAQILGQVISVSCIQVVKNFFLFIFGLLITSRSDDDGRQYSNYEPVDVN